MSKGEKLLERYLPAHDNVDRLAAPWMAHALKEWDMGVRAFRGSAHNDRVVGYFDAVLNTTPEDDEEAWCSAFANWVMMQAGFDGSWKSTARSWRRWGEAVPRSKPRFGAITVITRPGGKSWQGHVGFYVASHHGKLVLLGGNQRGHKVSLRAYDRSRLLDFRWPAGHVTGDKLIDLEGLGVH